MMLQMESIDSSSKVAYIWSMISLIYSQKSSFSRYHRQLKFDVLAYFMQQKKNFRTDFILVCSIF